MPSAPSPTDIHFHTDLSGTALGTIKYARLSDRVLVWVLWLFVFALPTDIRLMGDKSIAMRIGYACLFLGIIGLVKHRHVIVPALPFWILSGFVIWSSCTLLWAQYPDAAQHKVIVYWRLFIVTSIILQYTWRFRCRALLMDAFVYGCWLGVLGIFINFWIGAAFSPDASEQMEGRYSFFTDPNYLALGLVVGVPLAIYRSAHGSAWQRRLNLLYVPSALIAVILTGSRGALVSLLAAVLVYAIQASWKTRAAVFASTVVFLLIIGLSSSKMFERFSSIPDELLHGTLADRRDLWDRSARVAMENPLEGIGAGASAGRLGIAAHNTPLELTMEGGAIGVALFYGAALLGIIRLRRTDRREAVALITACAAWVVGGLSLSCEEFTVSWFLLALLFSAGISRMESVPLLSEAARATQLTQATDPLHQNR